MRRWRSWKVEAVMTDSPQPPAPEARFDGFLRWAESTGAGGTWEIERDVARALAARLRQAERKAEYAWKFVGRCEVAEGKLRELKEALTLADVPLGRIGSSEPFSAKEYRRLGIEARDIVRRALLGSGEGQEPKT